MDDLFPPAPWAAIRSSEGRSRWQRGPIAFALVFGLCLAVSVIAWTPLSWPPTVLRALLAPTTGQQGVLGYGSALCDSPAPNGVNAYVCAAALGTLSLFPPAVLFAGLFVIRRQLAIGLRRLLSTRVPLSARFLVAPMIATTVFVMSWAYAHLANPYELGVLPQLFFPATVGLFTFVTVEHQADLQRHLSSTFAVRNRFPTVLRVVAVFVVPIVVSVVLTSRSFGPGVTQQLTVLVSLAVGYLALAPSARKPAGTD